MSATRETQRVGDSRPLATLLEQNSEGILTCVHCGLCLPYCPTYRELGNENDSPRGRIYLMRGVVEGRIGPGDAFVNHIDLCLGCRACETVCPSGVPYGQLLEAARVEVAAEQMRRGSIATRLTRLVLDQVFTRPHLLAAGFWLLRLVRDTGLARLAIETGLLKGRIQFSVALLVASQRGRSSHDPIRSGERAAPELQVGTSSQVRKTAGVLRGCVMEGLFAPVNRATEGVVRRLGFETIDGCGDGCCGALHAHAGEIQTARLLARKTIDDFGDCDVIAVNSAGCGAAMKEYGHLLAHDPDYRDRARQFSLKVKDISELVADGPVYLTNRPGADQSVAAPLKIAYDAPCHLLHAQKVSAPSDLLQRLPGTQFVPLIDSESCCGGAGIYNLLHPDLSLDILSRKIANIEASGAQIVATGNPGCMMQIGAGLLLRGLDIQVMHPVELLDGSLNTRLTETVREIKTQDLRRQD